MRCTLCRKGLAIAVKMQILHSFPIQFCNSSIVPIYQFTDGTQFTSGGGSAPYSGVYKEDLPERGAFFALAGQGNLLYVIKESPKCTFNRKG